MANNKIRQYKKDMEFSYTLGVYPTIELLKHAPQRAMQVFISPNGDRNEGISYIKELCKKHGITVDVSERVFNVVADKTNIYAVGVFKKFKSELKPNENTVVLYKPADSGNLGTIIRTMQGFGINNLAIIEPAVDIFNPKTVRSSMGSVFTINFKYFRSMEEFTKANKATMYLSMLGAKETVDKLKIETPGILAFGSEAEGLPKQFAKLGTPFTIPQKKNIDSYNLAVSTGICLYEFSK
jgi:TrmH family RNA methyltransferase